MLFALPGYRFPYTVMNRCLSLPYMKFCKSELWLLGGHRWKMISIQSSFQISLRLEPDFSTHKCGSTQNNKNNNKKSIVEFHSRIGAVFPPQRNMKKRTTHLRHDVYFRNLLLGKAMMPRWHHHSFRFRFLGWWNLQCTPSGTQLSKNLPRPAAVADGLRAAAARRRSSSTVRALGKRAEEVGGCSAVLLDNCVRVSIVHCTFQ